MKKSLLLYFILFCNIFLFSQEKIVPTLLEGIWENNTRYIVFDTNYIKENKSIPQIVLKIYYQWYDDRAAEAREYTEKYPRDINNATQKAFPQEIKYNFIPLTDELFEENLNLPVKKDDETNLFGKENSGAWILEIEYPNLKEKNYIPIAIYNDELYLNFLLKTSNINEENYENSLNGFWQDYGYGSGILISKPAIKKELLSYIFYNDRFFPIRFWTTDMEYDKNAKAILKTKINDHDTEISISKHFYFYGKNFTCTKGKSSTIRNIKEISTLPEKNKFNTVIKIQEKLNENNEVISERLEYSTICFLGEPYLKLSKDTRTIEEIIKIENARRKPSAPPLFPPKGILDFDWSIIEDPPKDWNRRMLDLGK